MDKKITDIRLLKNKVVIYFNNEKLEINPNTYTEFNLYLNKSLSIDNINKIKSFDSYTKDLNYALNLVGKYAYTSKKLEKKLIDKKIKAINIKKIMEYLEERNLLDDLGFAKSYAETLMHRHKGENFIKERLIQLGINEKDINKTLDSLNQKDLKEVLITYIKKLDKDYSRKKVINKKNKIINSLLRSGYKLNVINSALSEVTLTKVDYTSTLKKDYEKFKRLYDSQTKIINALRRKGYSYSKIKGVMEDSYDIS